MTSSFRASMLLLWRAAHPPNTRKRCLTVCTAPTYIATAIYFQAGRIMAVHACELEWVLNISITAHRQ